MPGRPAGRGSGETVGLHVVTLGVMRPAALPATLSGRAGERARLLDVVRAGLDGSPRAVLVHGEAGIGKTTLVRSVCEQVKGEGAQVLWGQSLRFGAVEAMYHPLVLALEGWLGEADDAERASVVEAVPGAALILPSLGASPTEGRSMLMMVVDALLSRVIARGPTVLVVDDVQWADPATWDALSYLVAGFGHQRLALVTTHRDEAAVSEHFQHWLGNLRRLPGTEELVLTRLDEDATGDQIAVLLGRPPEPRLVEQVFEKVAGQPLLQRAAGATRRPRLLRAARRPARRAQPRAARRMARLVGPGAGDRPHPRRRRSPHRPADPGRHRRASSTPPTPGRSARPSTPGSSCSAARASGSGTRCWPTSWPRPTCPARRRRYTRPGPLTSSRSPPTASTSCADWATSRPTTSVPATPSAAFAALLRGADLAEKLGARREAADLLVRAADLWEAGADPTDTDRPRTAARARRPCLRLGRPGARRPPTAPLGTRPRLPRTPPALGEQTGAASGEARVQPRRDPGLSTRRDRTSRRPLPGRPRQPRARRRPVQRTPTPWPGPGGLERHDRWSRTPWRLPIARAPPPRSAAPMASGPRSCWTPISELADPDSTVCWEHALASGDPGPSAGAYLSRLDDLVRQR